MKEEECVLDVRGLSVQVQSHQGWTPVVDDVSFQIKAGQVLGIVGESGCGKSMTSLAILGLLPAAARLSQGSIALKGQELTTMKPAQLRRIRGQELSLIMQNPMTAFNPLVTIGTQFAETLFAHQNMTRKQASTHASTCLKQMNLHEPERILKQFPFELSGGMLQRVMIALSLSLNPSLLIADEPTTALDSINRRNVVDAFRAIKKEAKTAILLVSHDLNVIEKVADVVAVMKKGQLVEMAATHDLLTSPQNEYTQLLWNSRLTLGSRHEQESI
ncbi:nickel import ATP-binding protein NikD [Paenibacillus ferrarius]|uniref:Nickel import ATP-binding protein NikD n=1 Tax=Paenibacillus ferrarius TaxID=1469647 RepID=A0A1V4HCC1_9BACL|nr:ABC transporter ATP-binding protein [Paenibacillus ferrarius]OPH50495.1 nickel import ATP-binding protein NikD [Paenibacillus ferrarius]